MKRVYQSTFPQKTQPIALLVEDVLIGILNNLSIRRLQKAKTVCKFWLNAATKSLYGCSYLEMLYDNFANLYNMKIDRIGRQEIDKESFFRWLTKYCPLTKEVPEPTPNWLKSRNLSKQELSGLFIIVHKLDKIEDRCKIACEALMNSINQTNSKYFKTKFAKYEDSLKCVIPNEITFRRRHYNSKNHPAPRFQEGVHSVLMHRSCYGCAAGGYYTGETAGEPGNMEFYRDFKLKVNYGSVKLSKEDFDNFYCMINKFRAANVFNLPFAIDLFNFKNKYGEVYDRKYSFNFFYYRKSSKLEEPSLRTEEIKEKVICKVKLIFDEGQSPPELDLESSCWNDQ